MLYLKAFTFNPFQENTYVVYNEEQEAWIIDPGNSNATEHKQLVDFITEKKLQPSRLLLTHAHIDHILGNAFVQQQWGLLPEVHEADLFFISRMPETAAMYGVPADASPLPVNFLKEGDELKLGEYTFSCLHTPGHSPGSISFYNAEKKILLSGDVLFQNSIGRSDLPMGNHEQLLSSIHQKLMLLPDEVKVYSGHGPATTIGQERLTNPFLN